MHMTPEENPSRHDGNIRTAEKQLLILGINLVGFIGLVIIVYGVLAQYYQSYWPIFDKIINFFSIGTTLVGAILTFLSVYLPLNTRPPEAVSKKYIAPICIAIVALTAIALIFYPQYIHAHIINGIAILAIAGSLFRTVSR
jgi:hypothetical protein